MFIQARDIFSRGMRVQMTPECPRPRKCDGVRQFGTVRGFGRHEWLVRVQRDGIKTVWCYHARFWEPVTTEHS